MTRWLLALFVVARTASAETSEPWAQGVSEADQQRANALFADANQLFAQQAHAPALEKYQAAIAIWDHPVIRFNMAVTLVRLDRMLEAADALDSALRFGKTPFTPEVYAQVLDYRKLVDGRVGVLEVACEEPAGRIVLDGKLWFACPGTRKQRVLSGEHTVSGEHPTLVSPAMRMVIANGAIQTLGITFKPVEDAFTYEYRFRRWIPWTVVGGGVALGVVGALVSVSASNLMNDYNRAIARDCSAMGCDLSDPRFADLVDKRDTAKSRGTLGGALLITAGVGTVTGIVLVIINRPIRRVPKVGVAPSSDGAMAQATWHF